MKGNFVWNIAVCLILVAGMALLPGCKGQEPAGGSQPAAVEPEVSVSDPLNFQELAAAYAEQRHWVAEAAEMKLEEAMESGAKKALYRVLSVGMPVKDEYEARVKFYCKTRETDGSWEIASISFVELDGQNEMQEKPFSGNVSAWRRSIEYSVNGDFFEEGEVVVSGGAIETGLNECTGLAFKVQTPENPENFDYCYQHETQKF